MSSGSRLHLLTVAALATVACKSPAPKDKPETLARLDDCEKRAANLGDKDRLIQSYEAEIARLKLEGGAKEIVLTIEGDALTIKSRPQGAGGPPIDDKVAAALSQNYIDMVNKSRGSIQKCYEQALKKNAGLQARTITLKVSSSFTPAGAHTRSSFVADGRSLGDVFDSCMKSIASRWKLAPASQGMTFQATVSLSPS